MAKVERNTKFEPVVITLESQAELDYVVALLGLGTDSIAIACGLRGSFDELFNRLCEYRSPAATKLRGTITIK